MEAAFEAANKVNGSYPNKYSGGGVRIGDKRLAEKTVDEIRRQGSGDFKGSGFSSG